MNFLRNQTANLRARVAEASNAKTDTKEEGGEKDGDVETTSTSPSSTPESPPDKEQSQLPPPPPPDDNMEEHEESTSSDHHNNSNSMMMISDPSDRTIEDDVASIVASILSHSNDDAASDPEIIHCQREIRTLRAELRRMKQSGNNTRRRRANTDLKTLRQHKSAKGRELWIKQQTSKRGGALFGSGLQEYKTELMKCTLPSHDSTPATLTAEAKLLRVQHNSWMTDRQMEIVQNFQRDMIDYMYNTALPDIRQEHELAAMVGQSQVDKARKSKDDLSDLYEHCLGLQRKIIAKYRLRELEQQNREASERSSSGGGFGAADAGGVDDTEREALQVAAGEVPTMERVPELRDSAKARMEARLEAQG
eukprot:CAMPEP_0117007788 /NCGR_PEP_ID=MMETSP0472-20121206/7542_1 /TAXON_ID=693140 ORGANISM="Tiarina fusus, Strain LIS" /NCGR_SAMPLE_ID=MMETSP0472 /ASSEMBLY_ACC=CAM_ASM_000603 /LENGTH=364 /DNA_ID=CAMNT_0004709655 /DNA_START=180 /DNA_END=1270 /DNA_ORIENTATION=-